LVFIFADMKDSKWDKVILVWLLVGAFLVASMVILGGITRLTQSGLSMVEWKLIMGSVPPLNQMEWETTFERYQQFPEYQKLNVNYTLGDFKSIFWWEYSHRLLGRFIGIVFLIPFLYFLLKKKLDKPLRQKLVFILLMGAFQGFLGWFMVKSGLINDPHVSHYRLAAHLITAFFLFAYIFHLALSIGWPSKTKIRTPYYQKVLRILIFLISVQIIFGAFVAGLKAGLFYPTFPTMNGAWIPTIISQNYENTGWISLFNTVTSVQFIHRWLGVSIWVGTGLIAVAFGPSLAGKIKLSFWLLFLVLSIQALLGIFTLIYSVPIALAVFHQLGALFTLMAWVYAIHTTRISTSKQ
jgi:heme a synthase